ATVAIDAATCRPRWRHTWQPQDYELWPMNRGVALEQGYVVRGTPDGYLLALDARDGTLLWARHVADPQSGETITMSPLAYGDMVVLGPAGGENGMRGWIGAFRLADGKPLWRFNTVPRPGEPGAETWANPAGIPQGGGAVWTPLALDPAKGELYAAVTNPAPDLAGRLRPGTNLYTNALVALDPRAHLLSVPAVDWCGTFRATETARYVPGEQYLGGAFVADSAAQARGWLTAVDAARGTVRWRYRSARPLVAGVTATAGGVVFTGELTGDVIALNAETGSELYRFYTGAGVLGGVVTYAVNGRQYVAAASGGGSFNFGREGSPTILVFALPTRP